MQELKRPTFNLCLIARKLPLIESFQNFFTSSPTVKIIQSSFEDLKEYDCIISAGNSFGLMDGGIDLAVKKYFGEQVEISVKDKIREEYFGEMNVGEAFIINTGNEQHPFLLYCPTMRVPYDISGTDNAYKAMKAALTCIHQ